VKNFFYVIVLLVLLASCTATRKTYPGSTSAPPPKQLPHDPKYLENISIKPFEEENKSGTHNTPVSETSRNMPGMMYSTDIENCNALQFKYSILMEEPVEAVTNERLISFLESWYGTPYKFGGSDRLGIDCSAFSYLLMETPLAVSLMLVFFSLMVNLHMPPLQQGL
jgi:cell wall-associated NlpC family hydrolase